MLVDVRDREIMARVNERVPQFVEFLEKILQTELNDLPSASQDKVQVLQGRCLELQELLSLLSYVSGK